LDFAFGSMRPQSQPSATLRLLLRIIFILILKVCIVNSDLATELLRDFSRQNPLTVRSSEDIHAIGGKLDLSGETLCVVINRKDDVMRLVWSLLTIGFTKLQSLTVDDLLSIFRELHSDYLLVTETVVGEEGKVVRGLLSADELSRRLGVQVNTTPRPESFSDIVHAVRQTLG
jgi:hypothetical protein